MNSNSNPSASPARYLAFLEGAPERLLGMLDREPHSPTLGSFDREHWAWKFRDFPLGMLQGAAYPLALLWRHPFADNPYFRNPRVLEWLFAAIEETISRQHPNGAFDAFAPNEQDPGPTLGVLHGILEACRLMRDEASPALDARLRDATRKACDFAMHREETETHAFVSNHWALFAVALLDAAELTGDERCSRRAEAMVARIMREQSSDGWYNEYGGADPGYESLGIFHLAVYWRRTGDATLLDSLRRAIEFYAHCVHPDGSVGGVYGSRRTSLYFPGGFEILGGQIPLAAAVAQFLRDRLARGNTVTPATTDAENLPSISYAYLEAELAATPPSAATGLRLPCEALEGIRHFADSGIIVAGDAAYYAVANTKRGGLCRVFSKRDASIAYEDAGYLVRARGRWWTSQLARVGGEEHREGSEAVACETQLCEYRPVIPSPLNFLLLRLANLTLFRSVMLGEWLRRRIISRLILTLRKGPVTLQRKITFGRGEICFADTLYLARPVNVEELALPRALTAIHMGSAKYFHRSELTAMPAVPTGGMAGELNRSGRASCSFTLRFPAEGRMLLTSDGQSAAQVTTEAPALP